MGLVLGGVVGVVIERLLGRPFDRYLATRWNTWRHQRHLRAVDQASALRGEMVVLGDRHIFVHQFAPGGFPKTDLVGVLEPDESIEERAASSKFGRDLTDLPAAVHLERERLSGDEMQWNGEKIRLTAVTCSRDPRSEAPRLHMRFSTTDHATFLAVGRRWAHAHAGNPASLLPDDTLRTIDPLLSNSFGVNATVETADGKLIVVKRGGLTSSWHGKWHTSMNEGVAGFDLLPGSRVDVAHAFERGLREELGIELAASEEFARRLVVHTVMLDADGYEWGLLGHISLAGTKWSFSEIVAHRGLGAATDDWEASMLRCIPFEVDAVVVECNQAEEWVPHGLLNIVLSTISRHPGQGNRLREALLSRSRHQRLVGRTP